MFVGIIYFIMSDALPERYSLDQFGQVGRNFESDPRLTLIAAAECLERHDCRLPIQTAAELLIPDAGPAIEDWRRDIFTEAGGLACLAFADSNTTSVLREATLRRLADAELPDDLRSDNRRQVVQTVDAMAHSGYNAHPEFQVQIDAVESFFTVINNDRSMGKIAFYGAGFTVCLLDQAWQATIEHHRAINRIVEAETANLNWDDPLRWRA